MSYIADMSFAYDRQYDPQAGMPDQSHFDPQGNMMDYPAYHPQGNLSDPTAYDPQGTMTDQTAQYDDNYANEPPLMEELEINLDQIMQKTWAVLSFKNLNDHKNILHEPDLAGPLVFMLAFGFLLLLTGKIQFGYIYGLGTLGCMLIYFVVHLIAPKNISFMCTVSVLGYCLLPMVILSALSILVNLRTTIAGNVFSVIAILWCVIGASNLLVTAIDLSGTRLVIAYPCALFYTVFALLTVF